MCGQNITGSICSQTVHFCLYLQAAGMGTPVCIIIATLVATDPLLSGEANNPNYLKMHWLKQLKRPMIVVDLRGKVILK